MADSFEQWVQELGFENMLDFYKLVASVDLTNSATFQAFEAWKVEDGTKAGLLQLIEQPAGEVGDAETD